MSTQGTDALTKLSNTLNSLAESVQLPKDTVPFSRKAAAGEISIKPMKVDGGIRYKIMPEVTYDPRAFDVTWKITNNSGRVFTEETHGVEGEAQEVAPKQHHARKNSIIFVPDSEIANDLKLSVEVRGAKKETPGVFSLSILNRGESESSIV